MPPKATTKKAVCKQQKKSLKKPLAKQKKPTTYNLFLKAEIARLKALTPSISHRDAFSLAASNWKSAPSNPINKDYFSDSDSASSTTPLVCLLPGCCLPSSVEYCVEMTFFALV